MSGAPRVRSVNTTESNSEEQEARPVLVPGGNKAKPVQVPTHKQKPVLNQPSSRPKTTVPSSDKKKVPTKNPSIESLSQKVLKRNEFFVHSNLSLSASCSSDVSVDSFVSRSSTGRIGRRVGAVNRSKERESNIKREKGLVMVKVEKSFSIGTADPGLPELGEKKRCAWVTPNTDLCYATFHDEEWGVPVHDDKKLFELLVLSGALAELTWPEILSKRQTFREIFMGFDPVVVSKMNEKKLVAPGSTVISLLSEPKIRSIVENSRLILKIIDEFGSFDRYCWSFVNQKPIINRFRYPRQVPVKSPKADLISKDLVKRGFRSVGPTAMYSFMQAVGLTNDHLVGCFRFGECVALALAPTATSDDPIGPANDEAPCVSVVSIS